MYAESSYIHDLASTTIIFLPCLVHQFVSIISFCFNILKQIPIIVSLQKYVLLANPILKNTLKLPQYYEPDKSNN